MARQSSKQGGESKVARRTRSILAAVLVLIGALSVAAFVMVHWAERQLFDTNNYVDMVAPLPSDPTVSSALGKYVVDQLFTSVDVTQKLSDALPEKAAFLASPLSQQLQTIADNTATKLIASDQFSGVWVTANRVAQSRLIEKARGTTSNDSNETNLELKLSSIKNTLSDRLGNVGQSLFSKTDVPQGDSNINLDLGEKFSIFQHIVKSVDFLAGVLPYLILASFLGAIAIARRRRITITAASITVAVLSLLQLIGIKALRPEIINRVQNVSYKPAAGLLYDRMLASFNHIATISLILSLFTWGFALFAGPAPWAVATRHWLRLDQLNKTSIGQTWAKFRQQVGENKYYIWGGGAILMLAGLAFAVSTDWQGLIKALMLTASFISIVELLAPRPTQIATA
ncbi:MAG TPA: hypothetical protein VLE72_03860 [Candidatus Saccharimonadales bacterium]|nr:hypothetical protein [Candidatus Saccharimonadales bacterium]